MKPDLLTLVRHEYAAMHPDRDTRLMPVDDTLIAIVNVLEGELNRIGKHVARLESKLTSKDAE